MHYTIANARGCQEISIDTPCVEGSFERTFVNKLSSIVKNAVNCPNVHDVDQFRLNYLLSEISSKSPFSNQSNDAKTRERLSIEKTLRSNEHCKIVNSRDEWDNNDFRRYLCRARSIVSKILGRFSYDLYSLASLSGGASTGCQKRFGNPFYKYNSLQRGGMEVTAEARPLLLALIENTPSLKRLYYTGKFRGIEPIKVVSGDVFKTVPKNSRIDRTILIQPEGNNLLQKAIGKYIRRRLKLFGVNLNCQKLNQELSRIGSLKQVYSTIDLASASDTVNARIVWELLPHEWYVELEKLRCKSGKQAGSSEEVPWHMFSAMGNAFTFELESLIFYALSLAACEEQGSFVGCINVFGDDIIVPNSLGLHVSERLTQCGFIVNSDKTFTSGGFRESCGSHWYKGYDVKPFYIRTGLSKTPELIRLANQLRKWAADNDVCDPRFRKLWEYVASFIPPMLHGGWDLESSDALVSRFNYGRGRRIIPFTHKVRISGEASLAATMQGWSLVRDTNQGWIRTLLDSEQELADENARLFSEGKQVTQGDSLTKLGKRKRAISTARPLKVNKTNKESYHLDMNTYSRNTPPPYWYNMSQSGMEAI